MQDHISKASQMKKNILPGGEVVSRGINQAKCAAFPNNIMFASFGAEHYAADVPLSFVQKARVGDRIVFLTNK
jgi:hypothetical protein